MADSTIVFVVLAGVVVLFVSDRLPVEIVAVGTALALWATGVLDIDQALAGGYRFGDYAKLGLPVLAWFFVVSVGIVPLIWPL